MMDFLFIIISSLSVVSACIFIFFVLKENETINTFGAYLCLCAVFEFISRFAPIHTNIAFFHLFTVLEFLILGYFFVSLFQLKKKFFIFFISLAIYFIAYLIWNKSISTYFMIGKNISDFIFILLLIRSIFILFTEDSNDDNIKYFIFGLMISACGAFTVYLFFEVLANISQEITNNIWYGNLILKIIAQCVYIYGLFRIIKIQRLIGRK